MQRFDLIVDRTLEDGRYVVTNNGADIPVGSTLKRIELKTFEPLDTNSEQHFDAIGLICVTLQAADIYRKPVRVIPHGWSAAISFEGSGLSLLRKMLSEKDDRTRMHLIG